MSAGVGRRGEADRGGRALDGRVAVVTGAGRGLGEAYARALAAAGAAVVVNDLDGAAAEGVAAAITAAGGRAVADDHPVGTADAADAIVAGALDAFGAIDVMVTNAGADRRGDALDLAADDWAFTLQTHLFGTIHCALAAGRAMRAAGRGGSIVTVVSDAFHVGLPGLGPYGTAKGGIYGFTRGLAAELQPLGIRVNAVAPPMTRTPPVEAFLASRTDAGAPAGELDFYRATIQEPADVAPIVVLLASDGAAGLHGHVFTMTRDSLALLRPNRPAVVQAEVPWTLDGLASAAAALTSPRR